MQKTVRFAVKSPSSRYVALDLHNKGRVLAEGRTAASVAEKVRKTGCLFSLMFVPVPGKTYVF